jgi:hypothetical protein
MSFTDFNTQPAKQATCAVIGAVGDAIADDTDAVQGALDAGYVVQGKPDQLYRITRPLRVRPETVLLNLRLVVDIQDPTAVFMDWTGLGNAGVFMFGGEVFSKCPQGTVLLRLDTPPKDTPQRCFIDLVRWTGVQMRKSADEKKVEFYTFP